VTPLSRGAGGCRHRHWAQRGRGLSGRLATMPAWAAPAGVVALALMWCTAVAVADPTRSGNALPHCPVKMLTGWDCPGCGSTRMLYSLMHADVASAARYNIVALVMLPVLAWAWLAWTARRLGLPRLPTWQPSSRVQQALLLLWLAFTVMRNLPWAPFTALHV
jgi:hypothetical protein